MKKKTRIKICGLALFAWAAFTAWAFSGTIIVDTNTYNGADVNGVVGAALPNPGYYIFDMVATSTPSSTGSFSTLVVYIQQERVSGPGEYYTVYSSTFSTCNGKCSGVVAPDMYVGGNVRAQWTVVTGSVTLRVTAREVTP